MKKQLQISPLPTISEILKEFSFLEYSANVRNMAYQIQFLEFLIQLENHYNIDRGLKITFVHHIIVNVISIIEHLLCVTLLGEKTDIKFPSRGKYRFIVSKAEKNGLITQATAKQLLKLIKKRSQIHLNKNNEILLKVLKEKDFTEAIEIMQKTQKEVSEYFHNKRAREKTYQYSLTKFKKEDNQCAYCEYAQVLDEDFCPWCGKIILY